MIFKCCLMTVLIIIFIILIYIITQPKGIYIENIKNVSANKILSKQKIYKKLKYIKLRGSHGKEDN